RDQGGEGQAAHSGTRAWLHSEYFHLWDLRPAGGCLGQEEQDVWRILSLRCAHRRIPNPGPKGSAWVTEIACRPHRPESGRTEIRQATLARKRAAVSGDVERSQLSFSRAGRDTARPAKVRAPVWLRSGTASRPRRSEHDRQAFAWRAFSPASEA